MKLCGPWTATCGSRMLSLLEKFCQHQKGGSRISHLEPTAVYFGQNIALNFIHLRIKLALPRLFGALVDFEKRSF